MRHSLLLLLMAARLMGCAPGSANSDDEAGLDDAEEASFFVGDKADGASACASANVLRLVNGRSLSVEALKAGGVHTRAAKGLVKARAGADALVDTADDAYFTDLAAVDAVKYVGPVAFRQLLSFAGEICTPGGDVDVIFSPQPYNRSHLARTAELIDGAQRSLDIAMYSFRDGGLFDAVERAADRGISIRVVFHQASIDRRAPEGSASARLEDRGIDVRWVNKIMHHKFVLVDGPRDDEAQAFEGRLATGSGNWSWSAGTRFDENTLFLRGHAEANLRFQAEFNHLWENSRDFEWAPLSFFSSLTIDQGAVPAAGDDAGFEAVFTSENFRTYVSRRYGPTFSYNRGSEVAADRLVRLIDSAERSIHVASGHLRSKPITEALLRARERNPGMDIRIYLDGQEFVSLSAEARQRDKQAECLNEAATARKPERAADDCQRKGFRYSYTVHAAGIETRLKHYAYRWDYRYAVQMHHKYLVVDARWVATGSYNLSDNAESNTLEDLMVFDGAKYPQLVQAFEANFDAIWQTGADRLGPLMQQVESGRGTIPLVYPSMALSWDEISTLKAALREACPAVMDDPDYYENPSRHRDCPR